MKRFSEQFNKKADSIKLKATEKREIRERLLSYMEYHPLPAEMKKVTKADKKANEGIVSEPFFALHLNMSYIRSALSTVAALVVIAVPFVAERSLPGDALYPVKVQFNEEVRSKLSLSPYAKVEWETERLERRISEARLLAKEGKLTEEVEAQVAEAVKEHSDNAQKEIAFLKESDADEAAIAEITFASALAVQSEMLEGQIEGEVDEVAAKEEGRSVVALAGAVAEEQKETEASQATANPSYEKLLARVEMESTEVAELFTSISELASTEEARDIERRMSDINRKVNKAIALHESTVNDAEPEPVVESEEVETAASSTDVTADTVEDTSATTSTSTNETVATDEVEVAVVDEEKEKQEALLEAKALLRSALFDMRKLISFMTDIDVRESVSIDNLLPVELTADELVSEINDQLAELQNRQKQLDQRQVMPEREEKYAVGYEKLEKLITGIEKAREEGNYETALLQLEESNLVIDDLLLMTKVVNEEITNSTSTPETATSSPETSEETTETMEEPQETEADKATSTEAE